MQTETTKEIGAEIEREAESIFSSNGSFKHAEVLQEILAALKNMDFRKEAGLKKDEKLSQKHLVVSVVRAVLKAAQSLNCGICLNNENLYAYNGHFWRRVDPQEFQRFLTSAAERLGVDSITAEYHKFVEELFKQFLKRAFLPRPESESRATLINLRNGTFEIDKNNLTMRPFSRADFMTYQLPFDYDPNAECPKWLKFLDEVLPDRSKQMILAEYIGYVFAPQLKLEKALLLFGFGQNGKSVVFDVINALLGKDNISNFSLEALSHEYYRAMIADKLLNYSSEISNRLEAQKFKQLTSGEPMEARSPYGKPFILRDYARLAFNTNELPRDVEHTDAFFRRFLILTFDVKIPNDRKNPNLAKEIIADELSGIFNWCLAGLKRLLIQNDFSHSGAAESAVNDYRRESDSVAMFLEDEGYAPHDEDYTLLKTVYREYRNYCADNGYKPIGNKNFVKRIESLGFTTDKNRVGKVIFLIQST